MQDALVREHALDRGMYDTGFTMGVLRGLLTALIIVGFAWPAANFFGDARLTDIFLVLALALFGSSLENIGTVDFQRDMAFGKQVPIQFVPRVAGVVASITCAVIWQSYWALVAGILVSRGARLLATYVVHPYRPRITLRAWRRLVGFSFWSWANSMTALVQGRADTIVIGGYLNPTEVGIYSIGAEVGGTRVFRAARANLSRAVRRLHLGATGGRRNRLGVPAGDFRRCPAGAASQRRHRNDRAATDAPGIRRALGRGHTARANVRMYRRVPTGGPHQRRAADRGRVAEYRFSHRSYRYGGAACRVAGRGAGVWPDCGAAAAVAVTAVADEAIYLVVTFRRTGLRARDLAGIIWRPAFATGGMVLALLATGLTQPPSGEKSGLVSGLLLGATVVVGALVFVGLLLLAWLASGRRRGAETDLLSAIGQTIPRWRGRRSGAS